MPKTLFNRDYENTVAEGIADALFDLGFDSSEAVPGLILATKNELRKFESVGLYEQAVDEAMDLLGED